MPVPLQLKCELHLARHWDTAWRDVIRPWLTGPAALLRRDWVIVPTRGQAHAFKLRCVREGLPLLGVEFLTPGLARQKWAALAPPPALALGRELLLLGLRALIEKRLEPLSSEDPAWGLWKSLQSDAERALDDFDALLLAGFTAADFPLAPLREIFGELTAWVESLGFGLAPQQSIAAGTQLLPTDAKRFDGRLLICGLGAESWREFFSVAALARRSLDLTVVLPEPELRGAKSPDESWIELWSALLGVEAQLPAGDAIDSSCADVGALWLRDGGSAERAKLLVGHTRADEMQLVVTEIARLLRAGADNIAVIFPRADAAHLRLVHLLEVQGIAFNDLLETAGAPAIDAQIQRALLAFYERGARLEELLDLWPLLHSLNFVKQPAKAARDVCERVFDETQTHALAANLALLAAGERDEWREVARVAALLLPPWPTELTLGEALDRFESVCEKFHLAAPDAWLALRNFAERETRLLPARVVFSALASFLPGKSPAAAAPGRGRFAPVTLTTRRRAAGVAWSHTIFVESNAGVWPARVDASCWLTDEQRRELNQRGRFSLGLFTSEDNTTLEKQSYAALARDTREQVIFSAALFDEEEPELRLTPNAWVERVMIAQGGAVGLEAAFAQQAVTVVAPQGAEVEVDGWGKIWRRRREVTAPFDEHFLSGPPAVTRPERLAARLIERGVRDPAELWFEAVLGLRRTEWQPLVRARKKSLGQIAHRLLAEAMKGAPVEGVFMAKPTAAEARAKLAAALAALRAQWPRDRYWDSFHAELGELATVLLEKVFTLSTGNFVAVEARLPAGSVLPLESGETLPVHGRMDLVLLDRPAWRDAQVDIVDFKTGADDKLSAAKMARGSSLQLGIYLAALAANGAAGGRVWLLKPGGAASSLEMIELPVALAALARIGRHLSTGCYGALTPDRTEFSHGYEWPLACTPVGHAVLAKKFELTFGADAAAEEANDE